MGQALYRKYRSKSLAEIIGQEHITQTLDTALKTGRISHAYLFTGPRGVGKTSIARILAHEINGLPYADDSSHMDIIEIDAASNRRIDEIRELRDKVFIAPTSAKYKVYIIDEVHMLTKEAFNALLKTLEEPPAHVVFILATTDAHKLPETIVSRTQRFSFKPVKTAQVVAHLKTIAKQEGITIDDEALELLAEHGEGSFRDSISMLDQASSHNTKLTARDINELLGIPPSHAVLATLSATTSGSSAELMQQIASLYDQGYQPAAIAKQLSSIIRGQLVTNQLSIPYMQALDLLAKLLEVPTAFDSARFLEICLLQYVPANNQQLTVVSQPVPNALPIAQTVAETKPTVSKIQSKKAALTQADTKAPAHKNKTPVAGSAVVTSSSDDQNWQNILAALKNKHNTLYGLVRMAEPDFGKPGTICLTFGFDFHRKRLAEPQNQQKLHDIIQEITGNKYKIDCLVDKNSGRGSANVIAVPNPDQPAGNDSDSLANISNIFGGGELVE